VSVIDQTGDQRDHRRGDRADGEGVDLARLSPPIATERVTLRQMREQAGVALGDLAAQAGVSISTLRRFETGVPDLAPGVYAHTIAALELLKARSPR